MDTKMVLYAMKGAISEMSQEDQKVVMDIHHKILDIVDENKEAGSVALAYAELKFAHEHESSK